LYVDIDAHHGDGVESAFLGSEGTQMQNLNAATERKKQNLLFVVIISMFHTDVFTLSFHHHAPAFFPGSGGLDDLNFDSSSSPGSSTIGEGAGLYRTLNVPLKAGIRDESFQALFERVLPPVLKIFKVLDHILHEYSNFKCLYQSK
jgi:acetoin utilization deacetylase AcuC-like enzyme